MEEQKQGIGKLATFFIGLFSGIGVAAPITGFFVKKICEEKQQEKIIQAQNKAVDAASKKAQEYIDNMVSKAILPEEHKRTIDAIFDNGMHEVEPDENLEDYNLDIDDEEATEEARERTEEHERYLDMIDKYKDDPTLKPRVIDRSSFTNDAYMDKVYITWYDDNVFAADQENDRVIEDPYSAFGVVDGKDLFNGFANNDDPDIVYIRNEKYTTDYEITRIHDTYAHMLEHLNGPVEI